MAAAKKIRCPSCGFKNPSPLPNDRCVSCGVRMDEFQQALNREPTIGSRRAQAGFSVVWFLISIGIMAVLTGSLVIGLPMVVTAFDFEGSAGMMVAIPVWFVGGTLVGLISPRRAFMEPVIATFLVAVPTALFLFQGQTVKTMPAFMYVLMSALGVLFTLIGAYLGERIQLGAPAKASD